MMPQMSHSSKSFLRSSLVRQSIKFPVLTSWLQTITVCLFGTVENGRWQNELRWLLLGLRGQKYLKSNENVFKLTTKPWLVLHWSKISSEFWSFPYSEQTPPTISSPLYFTKILSWPPDDPLWPLVTMIWLFGSVTNTFTSESVRYEIPEDPKSLFDTSRFLFTVIELLFHLIMTSSS